MPDGTSARENGNIGGSDVFCVFVCGSLFKHIVDVLNDIDWNIYAGNACQYIVQLVQ